MAISLTEQELTEQFDFTAEDYSFLQTDVLDVANGMARPSSSSMSGLVGPQANCSGWYISNWDLTAGVAATLVTAADIGPVALAAAFTALASMVGGPVATVAALGLAYIGYDFFKDLAWKIAGAVYRGKGVCITLTWAYPPIQAAIM